MDPPGPVRPDAAPPARGREAAGLAPRLSGRALSPAPAFQSAFWSVILNRFLDRFPSQGKKTDFPYDMYRKSVFLLSIMRRLRL